MSSNLQLPPLNGNQNLTKTNSGVLKNPRGKQRKPKKEHQKNQARGITFGPLEESNEDLENDSNTKPRFSVVTHNVKRRGSRAASEARRASRGSIVRPSAILDNMNNPEQLDINITRQSLIDKEQAKHKADHAKDFRMSAHDDLVNARTRVAKRALLGGTVSLDFCVVL